MTVTGGRLGCRLPVSGNISPMPLFEYACKGCGQHFEAFVTAARPAVCPECQGADLQKLLSSPGRVGAAGRRESEAIPACGAQGGHCACSHGTSLN